MCLRNTLLCVRVELRPRDETLHLPGTSATHPGLRPGCPLDVWRSECTEWSLSPLLVDVIKTLIYTVFRGVGVESQWSTVSDTTCEGRG